MENTNIDKTFNEASKTMEEPATFPGFDKVWAKVGEKLDKKEEKKRKTISLWIPYGIAASLLIGSGVFYFTSKKDSTGSPQKAIAYQNVSQKEEEPAKMAAPVRKTDSIVKANIMKEILKSPAPETAYGKVPETRGTHIMVPVSVMPLYQAFPRETASVPDDQVIVDRTDLRNTEEIIAMGIRKEKASMVQELSAASVSKKKMSDLTAIADTAEAIYPDRSPSLRNENQEPEILAYNKNSLVRSNLTASASGDGNKLMANRIGGREASVMIRGKVSGVNINSISETPGSGKVDISITCQSSVRSNKSTLFIVDGKETDSEVFKKIDPKKIVSIQVFKDQKATALFGSKAVNGVVLVETRDISKKEKRRLKKLLQEKLPLK
ncbi:TonB-dependent receptor plug domain-containing protein [Chryseobacterium hagamense]|uniref:TonB-dependent receptor plug domain-containing protein n=1 Tax=Chryseobacterium hagamense TaxID=395935 RepID=A0A511YJH9_9FLAO|nr:TonB-dependent receptor plug domain-containing protein [Chryseobacterium hagamense]GEN75359.1 hypothetical protein CHA01nite_10990 [Chryseobacterium hagamense]